MPTRRRALLILAALALLALASLVLALMVGSVHVPLGDVFPALFGTADSMASEVVRSLRLPRALAGFACGGLLALAGALLQVLLRNPLADPYVLGISGGAGVGAILAYLGQSWHPPPSRFCSRPSARRRDRSMPVASGRSCWC